LRAAKSAMRGAMGQGETTPAPRIAAIDAARGVALFGMVIYHLSWDFAYFHLAPADLPIDPLMRAFSHGVAGSFLVLAGASLALAHRDAIGWRAFWRRLAIVGGAAGLVTTTTYFFAPQETIYFGILHCIAVASLLAAPMLMGSLWLAVAVSALVFAAPWLMASPNFNMPPFVWLGLGTVPPDTLDWRPLAPWSGCVFLGLALTRLNMRRLVASPLAHWRPAAGDWLGIPWIWAGRRSLAIYLIHQPVLFAILFAATSLTGVDARWQTAEFAKVCRRECVAGGGAADVCANACACVVAGLRDARLSRAITRDSLDDAERAQYSRIVHSCSVQ
jgi:uncharacterized membrane protein